MRLTIDKRGASKKASSRYPFVVEVPDAATVGDLKRAIAAQVKALSPERQRLTVGADKAALADGDSLGKYDLADGATVLVKDLGPQIGWQTVFYIEYAGPIALHYLIYNFQSLVYGQTFEHSALQQ
ncbi:3-oxo-5a-steroid 4- dehydrogenase [Coemansia helicoidea]|nr:3-oxo-5a-steroid 4- dehydrogenase [Coemansia helicoidea]